MFKLRYFNILNKFYLNLWIILLIHFFVIQSNLCIGQNLNVDPNKPLTISFDPPLDHVNLYDQLKIRCEFKKKSNNDQQDGENRFSMFLQCPIAPWGNLCFQNCQSACYGEKSGNCPNEDILEKIQCHTIETKDGHLFYEYTIHNLTDIWIKSTIQGDTKHPGISCKIAGFKTPDIYITKTNLNRNKSMAKNTEKLMRHTTTLPMTTTFAHTTKLPSIQIKQTDNEFKQILKKVDTDLKAAVTREILIVGAIIIVFISIMLNVFCCIRCVLIRQYSKSKSRAHMQHLFCMTKEIRAARMVREITKHEQIYGSRNLKQSSNLNNFYDSNIIQSHPLLIRKNNNVLECESYQPSVGFGSDYNPNSNLPLNVINDTNSSIGLDYQTRCLPDGKSGNRQSVSGISLIPVVWQNDPNRRSIIGLQNINMNTNNNNNNNNNNQLSTNSSQSQLAIALANLSQTNQKHLIGLQHYFNNNDLNQISNQPGSDGIGSCFGSIGQPDSSILDTNLPSSSGISTLRQNSSSRERITNTGQNNDINKTLQSQINPQSTYLISFDPNQLIQGQLPPNINASLILNRSQPMGSSQPHLTTVGNRINFTNSNPQLISLLNSNQQTLRSNSINSSNNNNNGGEKYAQSDSGAGSGSGKISLESDNQVHRNHKLPINLTLNEVDQLIPNNSSSINETCEMQLTNETKNSVNRKKKAFHQNKRTYVDYMKNMEYRKRKMNKKCDLYRDESDSPTEEYCADWSGSISEDGNMIQKRN